MKPLKEKPFLLSIAVLLFLPRWTMAEFKVQEEVVKGGIRCIFVGDPESPLNYFSFTFKGGLWTEPPQYRGLALLTVEMLKKGTVSRTKEKIVEELEGIGSTVDVEVGQNYVELYGSALPEKMDTFLEILSDMILNPSFPADEVERVKDVQVAKIKAELNDDWNLALKRYRNLLFRDHPFGKDPLGKAKDIRKVERKHMVKYHRLNFAGDRAIFGMSGKGDMETFKLLVEKYFGDIRPTGGNYRERFSYPTISGRRIVLLDKPERNQAQIRVGYFAPSPLHSDYIPLQVTNMAFGGYFSGRMNQEIRVKRGWSYGARSSLDRLSDRGAITFFTFPQIDVSVECLKLMLSMIEEARRSGFSSEEIDSAKSFLKGTYHLSMDTAGKVMDRAVMVKIFSLPEYFLTSYDREVERVSEEDLRRALQYFQSENIFCLLLAESGKVEADLKGLEGFTLETIPFDME